jgi:hypothetical protein
MILAVFNLSNKCRNLQTRNLHVEDGNIYMHITAIFWGAHAKLKLSNRAHGMVTPPFLSTSSQKLIRKYSRSMAVIRRRHHVVKKMILWKISGLKRVDGVDAGSKVEAARIQHHINPTDLSHHFGILGTDLVGHILAWPKSVAP